MKFDREPPQSTAPIPLVDRITSAWQQAYPDNRYSLHQELRLLRQMGLLLVAYTLMRGIFLLYNLDAYAESSMGGIFAAFLKGLHFDIAILIWLSSPLLLINLLPWPARIVSARTYRMVHDTLFWLLNIPALLLNILDMEFFKFVGRRSTQDILALSQDIEQQWLQQLLHYWHLFALFLLFAYICTRLLLRVRWQPTRYRLHLLLWLPVTATIFLTLALTVRGGFQVKPMSPVDANRFENSALAGLALNTPYTVLLTEPSKALPKFSFYPDLTAAREVLEEGHRQQSSGPVKNYNVVILIVESLGLEFFREPHGDGVSYVPFLEMLSKDALFFENGFANSRDSANAVPAILGGLPHMMDQYFGASPYSVNRLEGIGSILKKRGYSTHFFHGGGNGTMYFDVVSHALGVDHYYGLEEYPNEGDYDGTWGIRDEPYLQYVAAQLSQQKQPFFSTIFTLSSHTPYIVPAPYDEQLAAGPHPIHKAIRYADLSLKRFFERAKEQPWFDNTLFVITADHVPADRSNPSFNSELGLFRVPIIFYHPTGEIEPGRSYRIAQQADILPTLLDYLGLLGKTEFPLLPFGHSLFDESSSGEALLYTGQYLLVTKDGVARLQNEKSRVEPLPQSLFRLEKGAEMRERDSELVKKLEAAVQFFTEGMQKNRLYE
ncbi:MAG: sulfatase-like hydrolase/transferase [Candidatus Polarisedimenticolaceae bacterium]|nr:sulfatase-like hydrolase/transferase [Candidatus Polarisedimenticolaceae bacterium]